MDRPSRPIPDTSALRVALWRAIHVQVDSPPHVLEDEIGLKLAAPEEGWRSRPDMNPEFTKSFRASIVGRSRFIEDLVIEKTGQGIHQYVILGAGLDTFAQRRPEVASLLRVFEVDQPGHQQWKRKRLIELGYGVPEWLEFVPVDFESGESWMEKIVSFGFDVNRPAVVTSTGVSMYLTREAIATMLRQVSALAPGSVFVMTFLLPLELVDEEIRPGFAASIKGAQASGTPFLSFFTPSEMLSLARESGFRDAKHMSGGKLAELYFANRTDGLRPPANAEEILIATT